MNHNFRSTPFENSIKTIKMTVSKNKHFSLTSSLVKKITNRRASDESHKEACSVASLADDAGSTSTSSSPRARDNSTEIGCLNCLKDYCKTMRYGFSDAEIYRFAAFHSFRFEPTRTALRENRDNHYLYLSMGDSLKKQIETRMLFPLPNMKTKKGNSDVIYMRPSRYIPGFGGRMSVFENLAYVLNDVSRTKEQCTSGIAVVANMEGFTKDNFDKDYWGQLMQMLEGELVPTRINLVLFVNPPSWFSSKIWKLTKSMLSDDFSKNVHTIQSDGLSDFLMDGYESLLPDEIPVGWKCTDEIVEDYVDLKKYQESRK